MKHISRIFVGVGITLLLAGCAGLNADRYLYNKQTFMLNQGNPPAYVAGYVDGCASGRRLGGDRRFSYRKNNTRFDKDALYARGWQEAQINCRNETLTEGEFLTYENLPGTTSRRAQPKAEALSEADRKAEEEMRSIWEELKK
jgi:hypothetical protein